MMKQAGKLVLCLSLALGGLPLLQQKLASADSYVAPQIASGYYHSISLGSNGTVWSWGNNDFGQLGIGSTENSNIPVQAAGLTDVIAVAGGVRNSVALKQDGTVWAWGRNVDAELGDGTTDSRNVAIQVPGLENVTDIAGAVGYHSLGLKADGTVWAWGRNVEGELGDGTTMKRTLPVQVDGLNGVTKIASGGYFSLALKSNGTVWAWGINENGELGDGTTVRRTTPVQVAGLTDVIAIAAGGSHSVALKSDGTVWTWGQGIYGQIGDGWTAKRTTPVQVAGLADIIAIAGGGYHSLALTSDGKVWSWGSNGEGQLGDGTMTTRLTPVAVTSLSGVTGIAAGGFHSIALTNDGAVWGWGYNGYGQLSDRTTTTRLSPVRGDAELDLSPPAVDDATITASSVTTSEATLSWNKATDNISAPSDLQYRVYRSDSGNIGSVGDIEANGTPIGVYTADIDTLRVTELAEQTTVYFNVIVKDKRENKRAYAMQPVTTPGGPVLPSSDATLSSLAVNAGGSPLPIRPLFARETTEYSVEVDHSISSVTVTASVYNSDATVTADVYDSSNVHVFGPIRLDSGQPSAALPLRTGGNRIELTVTAQDAATRNVYSITVTRKGLGGFDPDSGSDSDSDTVPQADAEASAETKAPSEYIGLMIENQIYESIAVGTSSTINGRTVFSVKVNAAKLEKALSEAGEKPEIVIPVTRSVAGVIVEWNGNALKAMETKQAVLVIRTPNGNYRLPAAEISLDRLAAQLGQLEALEDATIRVEIAKSGDAVVNALKRAAERQPFTVIVPPVDFRITASYHGKTAEPNRFQSLIEREIPLPNLRSASVTSTAVVISADGSIRHVPTRMIGRDGKYVAVVSSFTNSSYALIWNPVTFSDVQGHWSEAAVNTMAARMIVNGASGRRYQPDAPVTRAEFTAMLVRALGLPDTGSTASYSDVKSGDWFMGAAAQAEQYGIVKGYEDGTFRPMQTVSRQEAAVVLIRTMKLAGLETGGDVESVLSEFADGDSIVFWARQPVAAAVQNGLMKGDRDRLMPESEMTRAEAAAVIYRMLTGAGLIGE